MDLSQKRKIDFHLVSPSTGETLAGIMRAALTNFDNLDANENSYFLVRSAKQIERVKSEITNGVVLHSYVKDDPLRLELEKHCAGLAIPCFGTLDDTVQLVGDYIGQPVVGDYVDPVPATLATYVNIHLVSDSTGETLAGVMRATAAQFGALMPVEHSYFLVRSERQIDRIVSEIGESPGLVMYSLSNDKHRLHLEEACARLGVPSVAPLDGVFRTIASAIAKARMSEAPDASLLPPVAQHAPRFERTSSGALAIVLGSQDAGFDALLESLKEKADTLLKRVDAGGAGANLLTPLAPVIAKYRESLDRGPDGIIEIWANGNTLRFRMAADLRRAAENDPLDPPIPLDASALLGDVVETHNAMVGRHPEGRALDSARLGPLDRRQIDEAVKRGAAVVGSLSSREQILEPTSARAIDQLVSEGAGARGQEGIASDQAAIVAVDGVANLINAVLRQALTELRNFSERDQKRVELAEESNQLQQADFARDHPGYDKFRETLGEQAAKLICTYIPAAGFAMWLVAANSSVSAFLSTSPHLGMIRAIFEAVLRSLGALS